MHLSNEECIFFHESPPLTSKIAQIYFTPNRKAYIYYNLTMFDSCNYLVSI